jgi:putative ABC transport system permease protein
MEAKSKLRNLLKIALRNLTRYRRRTLLTVSLIAIGLVFVQVFLAASGSMKRMIIGQITDSMMGHIQIHRSGYIAAVDNLPLDLNLSEASTKTMEAALSKDSRLEAYSRRIKFGGMLSNYAETTTIRLNGIDPDNEFKAVPLLLSRIIEGKKELKRGEILVPVLLYRGMNLKIGSPVVVVATNRDGSVNGRKLVVSGVLENVVGPMGRDGYLHIDDAEEILRMEKPETSEVVVRLKNYDDLFKVEKDLKAQLKSQLNTKGKPIFEVHAWTRLHPFANIAAMLDIMTFSTTLMLVAIVLISIMNVMTMAVYERIREIGAMIAMGTLPQKVSWMFLLEGLAIGLAGVITGNIFSLIIILILRSLRITFPFMRLDNFVLSPEINTGSFIIVSIIVLLISTLASLWPAVKASKTDPAKTLSHI